MQNFHKTTIGEEEIRLIPIEITGKFNNEFNEIWLKIEIGENKEKKTTIQRENLEKTSQLSKRKFTQSDLKWHEKMKNLKSESNEIPFNIQIEVKIAEKNDMWKTKFAKCGENFTILAEKIHWIRSEMTGENVEFPNESNEVWLNIHIEVKVAKKWEKGTTSERKIWKIYTKFHSLRPTNSLNQTENDRRKCRISQRIQRNSIEDSTKGANEKKTSNVTHSQTIPHIWRRLKSIVKTGWIDHSMQNLMLYQTMQF